MKTMRMVFGKKTVFGAAVLILILLVFAVFAFLGKKEETLSVLVGNTKEEQGWAGREIAAEPREIAENNDFSGYFEETAEKVFISVEDLKKRFEPKIERETVNSPMATDVSNASMSDEEYFSRFYPPSYIVYLNTLQDWMLRENYVSENEKIAFKTEEDSFKLFLKLVDFLVYKEIITEEQGAQFKEGVDVVLRELAKFERPFQEERLRSQSFLQNVFFPQLMAFLAPKVNACGINTGYPDCYVGEGAGGPQGYNSWSYCCNCGLWCGYGCSYVYDCGPTGAACNSGWYGCLNGMCRYSNAIWDPMTGICGCG